MVGSDWHYVGANGCIRALWPNHVALLEDGDALLDADQGHVEAFLFKRLLASGLADLHHASVQRDAEAELGPEVLVADVRRVRALRVVRQVEGSEHQSRAVASDLLVHRLLAVAALIDLDPVHVDRATAAG